MPIRSKSYRPGAKVAALPQLKDAYLLAKSATESTDLTAPNLTNPNIHYGSRDPIRGSSILRRLTRATSHKR